jgi:hypothetical protein
MDIVNSIVQGDRIDTITIEGDTTALLANMRHEVEGWNKKLEK